MTNRSESIKRVLCGLLTTREARYDFLFLSANASENIITRLKHVCRAAVKFLKIVLLLFRRNAHFPLEIAKLPTLLACSIVRRSRIHDREHYVGSILDSAKSSDQFWNPKIWLKNGAFQTGPSSCNCTWYDFFAAGFNLLLKANVTARWNGRDQSQIFARTGDFESLSTFVFGRLLGRPRKKPFFDRILGPKNGLEDLQFEMPAGFRALDVHTRRTPIFNVMFATLASQMVLAEKLKVFKSRRTPAVRF